MNIGMKHDVPVTPTDESLVEVVVTLRSNGPGRFPSAAESKLTAENVLRGAIEETGLHPDSSTVLENINSFSVRAQRRFVDALSRSDDVEKVFDNQATGIELIAPVSVRPVKL